MMQDRLVVGAPLTNALVFSGVVLIGSVYIVVAKLQGLPAVWVTFGPVVIMVLYALAVGLARSLRLRDDQSGDNLYYMGFLFTLTSLGVALYQFNAYGAAELIVQNFGIAIASTIAGIALRIFFNQMRRDPVEVESIARLELAEASRKVRREMEAVVLELNGFRRATQQAMTDGYSEIKAHVDEVSGRLLANATDLLAQVTETLRTVSSRSGVAIDEITTMVTGGLEVTHAQLTAEGRVLSTGVAGTAKSLDDFSKRIAALQTPDHVIEIKLSPMIQGLSRAINTVAKSADEQTAQMREALTVMQSASDKSGAASERTKDQLAAQAAIFDRIAGTLSAILDQLREAAQANAPPGVNAADALSAQADASEATAPEQPVDEARVT